MHGSQVVKTDGTIMTIAYHTHQDQGIMLKDIKSVGQKVTANHLSLKSFFSLSLLNRQVYNRVFEVSLEKDLKTVHYN